MTLLARVPVVVGAFMLLCGCAHREAPRRGDRAAVDTSSAAATQAVYRQGASRPSSALAFTPPVVQDAPLELSRDERRPAAFVGYPEGVAEFFYVRWDDRQAGGDGGGFGRRGGGGWGGGSRDRYERRAVSEKVGVLYR